MTQNPYSKFKGLSKDAVNERIEKGLVNEVKDKVIRSTKVIVLNNTLTLFNFINLALFVVVMSTGSYKNALFIFPAVLNTFIGIFQEIRAKYTLTKLSLLNVIKTNVIRDDIVLDLPSEQIVQDDMMILRAGEQIPVDATIIEGHIEVNEALLTGESDTIDKLLHDQLKSGSFVVSGECVAHVDAVGEATYISKYAKEARNFKLSQSELRLTINRIVKYVSWAIFPLGLLLFLSQVFLAHQGIHAAILSSTAAIIGMIPEGLVLLISISLMLGAVKMGRYHTLVQELPAIEMLARTTTLCLDKTGTITTGEIKLDEIVVLEDETIDTILKQFAFAFKSKNPTQQALIDYYKENNDILKIQELYEFSSERKYSAFRVGDIIYRFGAPDFLIDDHSIIKRVNDYSNEGYRVLVLTKSSVSTQASLQDNQVMAIILFSEQIRREAFDTIHYFYNQDVNVKIFSGDNPVTVAAIARKVEIRGADKPINAKELLSLSDEEVKVILRTHNIFGRVSPQQKQQFVQLMQEDKEVVAMTGDGVNDVLALKNADCSIAMANGSEATRTVSQLVLLDSNFASLPKVVLEGRRVINNIEKVASIYLVKIIYTILLVSIFSIFALPYPFLPIQMTLVNATTIGVPTFFLAMVRNDNPIKPNFSFRILRNVIPGGIIISVSVLIMTVVAAYFKLSIEQSRTFAIMVLGSIQFAFLIHINRKMNPIYFTLFVPLMIIFALAFILPQLRALFSFTTINILLLIIVAVIVVIAWFLITLTQFIIDKIYFKKTGVDIS